jgi:hypothetical protein
MSPASGHELDLSSQLALFELTNRTAPVDAQGNDPLKTWNAYEELVAKLVDTGLYLGFSTSSRAEVEGNDTVSAVLQGVL